MKVHLFVIGWNEGQMLPYFFRHYDSWVDRYVVFDDGSDDGSLETLRAHPRVEVRPFVRRYADAFVMSQNHVLESVWKESIGEADWVLVPDFDEFLHVPGEPMRPYLEDCLRQGVTYLPAMGFSVVMDNWPDPDADLARDVAQVTPDRIFNKPLLFRPDKIRRAGFTPGRHAAFPAGRIVLPAKDRLVLYHCKHLGFQRTRQRQLDLGARLGRGDEARRHSHHYQIDEQKFLAEWSAMKARQIDARMLLDGARPFAEGPLWWRESTLKRRLRLALGQVDRRLGGRLRAWLRKT